MKLVVIPSESIEEYIQKGHTRLQEYYNPNGFFSEVYLLSPKETEYREEFGMTIIPISSPKHFVKTLRCISPDVVRAYGGYWANRYANKYTPLDIPVIVSLHDTDPLICFDFIKYSNHVICMTNAVKKLALKKEVKLKNISILPNRVSLDDFEPNTDFKKEWEHLSGTRYILHIGRRGPQKNLETVIRSMVYLPSDIKLISIGKGDNRVYETLAKSINVDKRCIWIDAVKNNELSQFYSNAIAFTLPTRWEGFGVVFIEAAAVGVPIITSNIEPMNEFLIDEDNCLLLSNHESPEELSDKIKEIDSDKKLSSKISMNAIDLSKKYERNKINEEEIEIYMKVISSKSMRYKIPLILEAFLSLKSFYTYVIYRVRNKVRKVL
ncbi:glycosyltransferase [Aliivibrio fischeri]|uniref:glycosyltransferase n=1 Tax=Aliivibrio fischeri TaxID=668 RepID=UPI0012DA4956|nr:glycosyltransferase [Aliivibrio fischeri]MUL16631.1 glycosyltransferase [Aliivibrio fischeri]